MLNELFAALKTVDFSTLNIMGNAFRRLDRDIESADCYERAFELHADDEQLGLDLFFSTLKSMNFKRCQMVALKLFKKFGRYHYYLWSAMCLYCGTQTVERGSSEVVALGLVEKMVQKALVEKKLKSFQDYSLCLLVSDKNQGIMNELLQIPDDVFPTQLDAFKWKVKILVHTANWDQVITLVKATTPTTLLLDDWEALMCYMDAALHVNSQVSVDEFLIWDSSVLDKSHHKRAHFLAMIAFYAKRKLSPAHLDEAITNYFDAFGDKDACFPDLLPYLPEFTNKSFFTAFLEATRDTADSLGLKTKVINAMKIHKYLSLKTGVTCSFASATSCKELHDSWASEGHLASELIILHVICLLEEFSCSNEVSLLYKAACTLEAAINGDETNFYLKLLLIFILRELGGVSAALKVYDSLNIKNIQLDMLSYVVFDWMPIVGFHTKLAKFCDEISSIYVSNSIETPLMLIEAFRHCSYSQIPEFVDFHTQLKYSIQKKIIDIARIQTQIISLDSKNMLVQFFKNLELPVLEKTVVDNRPVDDLFSSWSSFPPLLSFIKKNGIKDTSWLETSYVILAAMKSSYGFFDRSLVHEAAGKAENGVTTNSLACLQMEELLKELATDNDDPVEPLLKGLLTVVHYAYHQDDANLYESLNSLLSLLNLSLQEFSSDSFLVKSTPEAILVKIESLTEIVHYSMIFVIGSHHVTGFVNSSVVSKLIEFINCILNMNDADILPTSPLAIDSCTKTSALALSLSSDWKNVWSGSKKSLETARRILKSVLPKQA